MSNERKNIPKAAARITKHIFKPGINKYASGDLEEEFKLVVKESGRKKALIWYWKQVLLSLFPYIRDGISNSMMLFMNYMKLASRNLLKHKGYSLINIFGLTFGIACCLLMALAFTYGLSYDRFHENYSRLFRVRETQHYTDHTETNYYTVSPLGPTLKENFPEIIDATRIAYQGEMLLRYEDAKFFESDGIAVGKSFFDMLTFPFIKGDMATALNDPNSIVLNESIAEKLFGDIDPIGKILKVNNRYDLMVTGVFQDVKMNSTYQFSFVLPWEYMKNYEWFQEDRWDNHNHPTFVLLDENTQVVELEKKIINIFDEHSGEDALTVEISLQSFPDMCFYTEINGMTGMDSGLIFGFLALFILLISCINFMNLTTARSAFRYKEIGIRKVVGCSRRNIIIQFFSESLMLSFISLIVAIILIEPSLMIINSKMGMDLTLNFVSNWWMLAAMLGIAFVTGIISGSYPAFYLSSFSPLNIIKGTFNSGKRKPVMRRLLVSVQLGLTIIFLITGFVSSRQFDFLMNHDMGWERENLIYIRMRGESEKSIGILK
ncbi:MAG: FtsX-like permease family protein, partial [bacterium]|nr:FtsX-like permease family protein [bacterium]